MSVNKSTYLIIGYDLQEYRSVVLSEEFEDSDRYDELTCNQVKGEIQLFTDPMGGYHLYLGYIYGEISDDYDDDTVIKFNTLDNNIKQDVDIVLNELIDNIEIECQYIMFNEYS